MCNLVIGQIVILTGRKFCKKCGNMLTADKTEATFTGHDSGFDVFDVNIPLTCPWCETVNETFEMPCSEPIKAPEIFKRIEIAS